MQTTRTAPAAVAADADRDMFTTHARRFALLTWLAIGVSYVHQAGSLLLFSGAGPLDVAAGLGMTAIIDLSLWALGEYLYETRRAKREARWAQATFVLAIAVSIGLNFVYLYTHRPAEPTLKEWLSTTIAAVFALFVPLLIGVASRIRADLATWRGEHAAEQADARQLRLEARQLQHQLAELQAARRDLPLADDLAQQLREHRLKLGPRGKELVFPDGDGEPRDPNSLTRNFARICARLQLGDYHLHDLRATAITRWRERGIDLEVAAAMAGHEKADVTADVYSDATMDRKRAALEKMG